MKVVITQKALREYIGKAMFTEGGWHDSNNLAVAPIDINPVVDPSVALTDPFNEQTPTDRKEMKISLGVMIDGMSEEDVSAAYEKIKDVIKKTTDEEDMKKETQAEQIVRAKIRRMMSENSESNIENIVRLKVRSIIEAAGAYRDTGLSYSGAMTDAPSGYEWCDNCEGEGEIAGGICPACNGSGKVKKDPKYLTSKATGGASVADMVAAGIPQGKISGLMKSAMAKFKSRWPKEQSGELDVALLSAVPEYIEYLKKQAARSGEPLMPDDIQLMNDHPEIVLDSDEFRMFFNKNYSDY